MSSFKMPLPVFNWKAVALHILIWGALLGLPYLFSSPPGQSIDTGSLPHYFFTVTNVLHAILFYLNAYWIQPRLFAKGRRWQYIFAALALLGGFFYAKILLFELGIFSFSLEPSMFPILFFPTVLFLLISMIYRMVIDKMNFENEELETELKFLRSQINPHFLFNVLNNLVSMARYKSEQLEPSLIKLAGLMRYMMQESGDEKVSLAKEVEYLESYIELQKIRFSEDIPIRIDLTEGSDILKIEPMLLIPFVENAFKHGVGLIEDPMIDISLTVSDDRLFFEVKNRFNEEDNEKDRSSGIGLKNVKKRLDILYPDKHQLKISRANNTFKIHLKLLLR